MEQRLKRLDIVLKLITDSETPTAQTLLPSFVQAEFGITDRTMLETELEMLLAILLEDDYITEEEDHNRTYYEGTQSGIEFIRSGGYTADSERQDTAIREKTQRERESQEYTKKQSDNYLSPKVSLTLSVIALGVTIFFASLNYLSGNSTRRIEQLEKRVDSLQLQLHP